MPLRSIPKVSATTAWSEGQLEQPVSSRAPAETQALAPLHAETAARPLTSGGLSTRLRALTALIWVLSALSIPVMVLLQYTTFGWDLQVYANAIHALQVGHDPYEAGMAVQRAFHLSAASADPSAVPPYTYVYSPLTLPLLRTISRVSWHAGTPIYWSVYGFGFFAIVWAGVQLAEANERTFVLLFASICAFFPGLLQTNVIFSGNLAYPLYGLVLLGAVFGWRRGIWWPFYLTMLLASCFKAPLLSLVLIPVLSARGQWLRAGTTAAVGTMLFFIQPLLWPSLFRHYLQAVELQFSYNHDFGLSPSGLIGNTLFYFHLPYTTTCAVMYVLCALPTLAALLWLSRLYFRGRFSLEHWAPVMLLGVVLLNPRIKEYDLAPLSLPMALVSRRFVARKNSPGRTILLLLFFVAINAVLGNNDSLYKPLAGFLLVFLFTAGAWQLYNEQKICLASRLHALSEGSLCSTSGALPLDAASYSAEFPSGETGDRVPVTSVGV